MGPETKAPTDESVEDLTATISHSGREIVRSLDRLADEVASVAYYLADRKRP